MTPRMSDKCIEQSEPFGTTSLGTRSCCQTWSSTRSLLRPKTTAAIVHDNQNLSQTLHECMELMPIYIILYPPFQPHLRCYICQPNGESVFRVARPISLGVSRRFRLASRHGGCGWSLGVCFLSLLEEGDRPKKPQRSAARPLIFAVGEIQPIQPNL